MPCGAGRPKNGMRPVANSAALICKTRMLVPAYTFFRDGRAHPRLARARLISINGEMTPGLILRGVGQRLGGDDEAESAFLHNAQ